MEVATFANPDTRVFLLDANNAFNSINRQTALHNINVICLPFCITPMVLLSDVSFREVERLFLLLKIRHRLTLLRWPCMYFLLNLSFMTYYRSVPLSSKSSMWMVKVLDTILMQTHLIVKKEFEENALHKFAGTNVNITVKKESVTWVHPYNHLPMRMFQTKSNLGHRNTSTGWYCKLTATCYLCCVHGLSSTWTIPDIHTLLHTT